MCKPAPPYRRAVAAQALGELGDARAVELLNQLKHDSATAWEEDRGPKRSVGDIANEALKKLGGAPAGDKDRPWWKVW